MTYYKATMTTPTRAICSIATITNGTVTVKRAIEVGTIGKSVAVMRPVHAFVDVWKIQGILNMFVVSKAKKVEQ